LFFKRRASLSVAAGPVVPNEPLSAVQSDLDPGTSLTEEQISLRRMRNRLAVWFFLTAAFLCVCQILPREIVFVRWLLNTFSILAILSIFALFLEFSLIVLLSCCNLNRRYRF